MASGPMPVQHSNSTHCLPPPPTHTCTNTQTYLAGKQCEGALVWLEDVDDSGDEFVIALGLNVGLKADVGALALRRHVYCEVGVSLRGGVPPSQQATPPPSAQVSPATSGCCSQHHTSHTPCLSGCSSQHYTATPSTCPSHLQHGVERVATRLKQLSIEQRPGHQIPQTSRCRQLISR